MSLNNSGENHKNNLPWNHLIKIVYLFNASKILIQEGKSIL